MRTRSVPLLLVVLTGCTGSPAAQPSSTTPASATATPIATHSAPSATAAPTQTPATPTVAPSPTIFGEFHKLDEGAHGGPHPFDLPAAVTVEYAVRGKCTFEMQVSTEMGDTTGLPKLTVKVDGKEQTGSWDIELSPGTYFVAPNEAVGCTFDVVVRASS